MLRWTAVDAEIEEFVQEAPSECPCPKFVYLGYTPTDIVILEVHV